MYLIGTYILSIVLPWIKIEALKTTVPEAYYTYPEFLWNVNDIAVATVSETQSKGFSISWEYGLFFGGMFLASLFFANKLRQLYLLKKNGKIQRFTDFTQIIIANSQVAFSFFKSIFMGDKILEGDYKSVIAHELVHIKQRHTYDLFFFELMRIICWFNPLVYVYQNRVSELHEFIADAQVAKANKIEHYQLLLSQVFETQHISFINQFFKSSLIKKRIVMLQKSKSKQLNLIKYALLLPLVFGMLIYTSTEVRAPKDNEIKQEINQELTDKELIEKYYAETHLPLAAKIPGVVKVEISKVLGTPDGSAPSQYRMAEVYFNSMEELGLVANGLLTADLTKPIDASNALINRLDDGSYRAKSTKNAAFLSTRNIKRSPFSYARRIEACGKGTEVFTGQHH